jgi:hypothetical protein
VDRLFNLTEIEQGWHIMKALIDVNADCGLDCETDDRWPYFTKIDYLPFHCHRNIPQLKAITFFDQPIQAGDTDIMQPF